MKLMLCLVKCRSNMCLSPTVERCSLFQKEGPAPGAGPAPSPHALWSRGVGLGALGSQADLDAIPGLLAGALDT